MKILEFAKTHCAELVTQLETRNELVDLSQYPYDALEPDDFGVPHPVVYAGNRAILLADILGMSRDDFVKDYPEPECVEAYDTYLSNYIILEGREALEAIRNEIMAERSRIEQFNDLPDVTL